VAAPRATVAWGAVAAPRAAVALGGQGFTFGNYSSRTRDQRKDSLLPGTTSCN
jgi:hypothetical protein